MQILTQMFLEQFSLDRAVQPGGELLALDLTSDDGAHRLNSIAESFILAADKMITGADQESAAA